MRRPCALAAHMYFYADHAANTSAHCTGVGWDGVGHDNVMYACVTCTTPRYATLCDVDRQNHLGLKPAHCFNVQNDASWLPWEKQSSSIFQARVYDPTGRWFVGWLFQAAGQLDHQTWLRTPGTKWRFMAAKMIERLWTKILNTEGSVTPISQVPGSGLRHKIWVTS